jgi:DNA repair protein RadA/Sms
MAKPRTHYLCRTCGGVHAQWMGKCPDCGAWDALEKFIEPKAVKETAHSGMAESWVKTASIEGGESTESLGTSTAVATPLPDIETTDVSRISTGIAEFDRVLGGGLVPGSVVLLGGDPGIGKSTLMLQAAGKLAQADQRVLYVTSEESAYQTRLRAERLFQNLGVKIDRAKPHAADGVGQFEELFVLADTSLARIVEQARKTRPRIMVIDSIQMIYKSDLPASPLHGTGLSREGLRHGDRAGGARHEGRAVGRSEAPGTPCRRGAVV